jgi:exosortase F-associated protein
LHRITSIFFIMISLVALVCVRIFEKHLFYDPFIDYFKSDFQLLSLPKFDAFFYIISTCFRYGINLFFTAVIIWFMYKSSEFIKATLWVYLLAFLILFGSFFVLASFDYQWVKMCLFYVRRFLIHPILLFILVPGFYFISKTKSSV